MSEHDCMDVHAAPRLSHSVAPVTSARPLTSRRARRRRMRADARRRTGTHARRPIDDDRASTPHAKQLSSPPPAQLSNYVELFSGGFHSKDSFILTRAGAHIAHTSRTRPPAPDADASGANGRIVALRRASSSPVLAQAASADIAAVDAARASCPAAYRPEKESNPSNRRNAAAARRAAARIGYLKNAICTTFTITSPTASTR